MKFWLFSQLVIASLYLTVLTLLLAIVSWEKSQNCEMQICAKNSELWEKKLQLPFFYSFFHPFFIFFHSVAETGFHQMYSEQVQMCFVCVFCHCTVQMCNGVANVYNSCSRKAVSAAENNVFCVQMQEMTQRDAALPSSCPSTLTVAFQVFETGPQDNIIKGSRQFAKRRHRDSSKSLLRSTTPR